MFHSEGVGRGALALRLDTGANRLGPADCRPARPADFEDPLRAHRREDLRSRLLDMIIRNEQQRKLKPR